MPTACTKIKHACNVSATYRGRWTTTTTVVEGLRGVSGSDVDHSKARRFGCSTQYTYHLPLWRRYWSIYSTLYTVVVVVCANMRTACWYYYCCLHIKKPSSCNLRRPAAYSRACTDWFFCLRKYTISRGHKLTYTEQQFAHNMQMQEMQMQWHANAMMQKKKRQKESKKMIERNMYVQGRKNKGATFFYQKKNTSSPGAIPT